MVTVNRYGSNMEWAHHRHGVMVDDASVSEYIENVLRQVDRGGNGRLVAGGDLAIYGYSAVESDLYMVVILHGAESYCLEMTAEAYHAEYVDTVPGMQGSWQD